MTVRHGVAGVHLLLAAVHVYWATGATWPASDERSLSVAVLGAEVSFAPSVVLPLAALHVLIAVAALASQRRRIARMVVMVVLVGVTARGCLGIFWIFGTRADVDDWFYWLNLFVYTPACIALALADLHLVRRTARTRRWGRPLLDDRTPAP